MKISVSSYSFSQYVRSGKMALIDCIAKAKGMGFDAIEFTDLPSAQMYHTIHHDLLADQSK